ncbi:MAG: hypothetical protein AAGC64_01705 [Bacteroidota bacterium]
MKSNAALSLRTIPLFSSKWALTCRKCLASETSSTACPLAEYWSIGVGEQIQWCAPKIDIGLAHHLST